MKEVEMLFRVTHHHYGPKSESHDIACIVSCATELHLRDWLNKEKVSGAWNDEEWNEEEGMSRWELYLFDEADKQRAEALHLRAESLNTEYKLRIVCRYKGDVFIVVAPRRDIVLLHQGDDYQEGSDFHYGVSQWSWIHLDMEDTAEARAVLNDALGVSFILLDSCGKVAKKKK